MAADLDHLARRPGAAPPPTAPPPTRAFLLPPRPATRTRNTVMPPNPMLTPSATAGLMPISGTGAATSKFIVGRAIPVAWGGGLCAITTPGRAEGHGRVKKAISCVPIRTTRLGVKS